LLKSASAASQGAMPVVIGLRTVQRQHDRIEIIADKCQIPLVEQSVGRCFKVGLHMVSRGKRSCAMHCDLHQVTFDKRLPAKEVEVEQFLVKPPLMSDPRADGGHREFGRHAGA
jgi:hypothetical protein